MPRDKLLYNGPAFLNEEELLAILLDCGTKDESVFALSARLIKEIGGVDKLLTVSINDLIKIKGIKLAKAAKIIASMELSKRIFKGNIRQSVATAADIYEFMKYEYLGKQQEEVYVLFLDSKAKLIGYKLICIGGFTTVWVDIKALFAEALRNYAHAIILVHNHPSGDPHPSESDRQLTSKITTTGKILNICVLDHIIIGLNTYYSFSEHNLL